MSYSPEEQHDADMATALENFAKEWGLDGGYLAEDIGTKLTCREADSLANLLKVIGLDLAAHNWLVEHAVGDDEGDDHWSLNPMSQQQPQG